MEVEDNNIELRSEKVRSIIGQIPNRIVRFGTFVVSIIIIGIILACYFIKYPITIKIPTIINSQPLSIAVYAPASGVFILKAKNESLCKLDSIGTIEVIDASAKSHLINLISPINGIFLLNSKSNNLVEKGELLLIIRPSIIKSYTCQSNIPTKFISKLVIGQQVNIELSNYPVSEFGFLSGKVSRIYPIPIVSKSQSFFKIDIELVDGFVTSIGRKLPFYPNIEGSANIFLNQATIFDALLGVEL